MKLITVFAFASVATFVVLHSAYGSPLPEPVPDPSPAADPSPKADPEPVASPVADPGPGPSPGPVANPNPLPASSPPFVPLSANAEPMGPAPGAVPPKMDDVQPDTLAA
ncbi:tetra-peptide repeat homeobox protein 1 [Drosophila elegans]|uniref:tetra-peptide repeat homeobox protein 1 n=1 Tax=Drosophila elegans TaxID=30023 RepID=UPI0007E7A23F|nr:tetra-peptide repeat homeobox protein 1 [Drosophila elegans]